MAVRLDQDDSDFDARFTALLAAKREVSEDVEAVARRIVDDVRQNGDAALIDHTARLDGVELNPATLAVSRSGWKRRLIYSPHSTSAKKRWQRSPPPTPIASPHRARSSETSCSIAIMSLARSAADLISGRSRRLGWPDKIVPTMRQSTVRSPQ